MDGNQITLNVITRYPPLPIVEFLHRIVLKKHTGAYL